MFSTQPLSLDRVWPNGTIYIPEVILYAETSVGAENGKAICNYGGIPFFNTEANVHTQSLQGLPGGNYVYDIVCMDVAGNQDTSQISFTIEVDDDAPQLTGLYVQEGIVVYDIDESASCQFYFEEFTYGAGTAVSGSFGITDLTTYYLTCQDTFGNEGSYVINI